MLRLIGPELTEQLVTQARNDEEVVDVAHGMLAFLPQTPAESVT